MIEINKELDERAKTTQSPFRSTHSSSIFSQTKQSNFLNQELMFLLDDLTDKATKNGLKEEALIPLSTKKDKQIFKYLKSQKNGSEDASSATDTTTMNSSFYSKMGGSVTDDLPQNLDSTNKSQRCVSKLNIKNILELSSSDLKIVTEIKKFMLE